MVVSSHPNSFHFTFNMSGSSGLTLHITSFLAYSATVAWHYVRDEVVYLESEVLTYYEVRRLCMGRNACRINTPR